MKIALIATEKHHSRHRKNKVKKRQANPILEAYLTNSSSKKKHSKSNHRHRNAKSNSIDNLYIELFL